MSRSLRPDANLAAQEDEHALEELYDTVLIGFLPAPLSSNSAYSPALPDSSIARHISRSESVYSLQRSTSYTPSIPSTPHSPLPPRRRPLPQLPGAAFAAHAPRPQPSQPGPSTEPTQSHFNSNKRIYSQTGSQNVPANSFDPANDNVAAHSASQIPWNDAEGTPTSPSTEYPENGFLPGYYPNAHEDPNASFSYAPQHTAGVMPDYTNPPPPETYDDSETNDPNSHHIHHQSPSDSRASVGELYDPGPDASSFISDYALLRRPSDSSGFLRSTYPQDLVEEADAHLDRNNDHIAQVTINPTRMRSLDSYEADNDWLAAGPSDLSRRNTNVIRQIMNFDHPTHLELHVQEEDLFDDDERTFVNPSLLSHLAVQLRDTVPRGTHVKGSIPYPRAFTGKDIVSTLHTIIQRGILADHGVEPSSDRRASLLVARSLQTMLFFYEVEWGARVLQDGVEDVYMFMDDQEGGFDAPIERTELPTGVVTILTKCYSANCDVSGCYAYGCPRKGMKQLPSTMLTPAGGMREDWSKKVPPQVLASLTENEISRQTIIHKLISKEEQYIDDLNIVENVFIKPLRAANPPVMTRLILEEFIEEVFGNILELRECNRRLLEVMYVRQREQHPVIQSVGDIFLDAATEFRIVYPTYVGHHPLAEKRMKEELEHNAEFRFFIEKCSRKLAARPSGSPRLDLKHYLNRPGEHLQKYPLLLEAVYRETEESNPDGDYLRESIAAIQNLQNVAQLRTFQSAMGKGTTGKWEWHDLVSPDMRRGFTKEESKRQSVIFELIKGEMSYVRDLENIETMYVRPLRNAEPPIIPSDRLDQFLLDVFHNFNELHAHHRRLVDNLHEIQREEHPRIRSITAAVFDAALNFREAYMEYIPNYPIAAFRIDDEMANNPPFKLFVNHTVRHPDAHRLDLKSFINRPIPRLLRYELLLKEILSETPAYHDDRSTIPNVIELIKDLGRETEPGVTASKQKVELWKYNSYLEFKSGEHVDMDLLNEQRSLIHTGKLLRQPDSGHERDELFVMLFDNYFVMTHPKEKDGVTKYHVYRKPIPLDLMSLVNFTDGAVQRNSSNRILRNLWNNHERSDTASIASSSRSRQSAAHPENGETRQVFPCTIHYTGRLGGPYTLYAESAAARLEWGKKLEESLGLRKVVQESNKVFEIESLSVDTFLLPTLTVGPNSSVWHDGTLFTGKVTCSVPFNTPDGRGLVAIGCGEGVWIGYRHDSRSLRRVLHLKHVSQCAILEDFGLFLVLADKVLFAYHLEALVPTTAGSIHASPTPHKINGKDVHFFSVGFLINRTLVIYMKKRGNESVFNAVEPLIDKINERPRTNNGLLPGFKKKSEWFRHYKEFSFPDAFDLIFLKTRIAVLCTKGFKIMNLNDRSSVTIPQRDDPKFAHIAKRCDSCRPMGMFRSREDEFLLCYEEFGLFVDRHGYPSRSIDTIEWEGKAERVAMHAPYILLFDTRFIEIRHIETGRLVQIIQGNEIKCVWDGRGLDGGVTTIPVDGAEDVMVQEPRIHAVMNMVEPPVPLGGRPMRGVMQHVFDLFPTIPLYLPGSLASPSAAPYFPISFSPPRSPPLRSHHG